MSIIIPDDILQSARLTEAEVQQELAVALFQRDKLTLGQACRLAGMTRLPFQRLLASRLIPIHYGSAELQEDVMVLREMNHL